MVLLVGGRSLLAQGGLVQLGLTETAARNFVINEIKSPATQRTAGIVVTGTRAFLKLPPAARGPAATAPFAWAKTYVNSAPFKTAYANFRRDAVLLEQQYELTVEEEVKKKIDEFQAGLGQMRRAASSMPPADAASILKSVAEQEARIRSGELAKMLRTGLEAERAAKSRDADASTRAANDRYPADPQKIFARRLRQFLDETADANFSAKTISLTGGAWHRVRRARRPEAILAVAGSRHRGPRGHDRRSGGGRGLVEGDRTMNRRQAFSLLAASPLAVSRAWAQTRPTAQCRVFLGAAHALLLETGGTLKTWLTANRTDGLAPDWLGLGHNKPFDAFTLAPISGLTNVVTAAAGNGASFAVLADGRLLSWGWNSGTGALGTTPLSQVHKQATYRARSWSAACWR